MRKIFFKAGAAVMAAAMAMMAPMTAKADGVVATDGGVYTLPIIASYDGDRFRSDDFELTFRDKSDDVKNYWRDYLGDVVHYPVGYEGKGVEVEGLLDDYYAIFQWDIEVAGSKFSPTDLTKPVSFTLDYNGVSYQNCAVHYGAYAGYDNEPVFFGVTIPTGYDGVIKLNIYGTKMKNGEVVSKTTLEEVKNGEVVKDETKCLTYYLQGSPSTPAQQPAPVAQQPVAEQPVPVAQQSVAEQPVPVAQQPAPNYQGNTYTVKRNDNLSKIAKELYGDKKMWKNIYELNTSLIKNPNLIYANMMLMLP